MASAVCSFLGVEHEIICVQDIVDEQQGDAELTADRHKAFEYQISE